MAEHQAPNSERTQLFLLRGRERVRDLLEPDLGPAHALERANNIAQALALDDLEPGAVAFEMLRQLPGEARGRLAAAVRRAWLEIVEHEESSRVRGLPLIATGRGGAKAAGHVR